MVMELEEFIKSHQNNSEKSSDFQSYLFELIDKHGFSKDSDVYNKVHIDRRHYDTGRNGVDADVLPRLPD